MKNLTWVEINLDNLTHNLNLIKKNNPEKQIMAVVKADAYGHGAVNIVKTLIKNNINFFAVSNLNEALELRRNYPAIDILILGYTNPSYAQELIENNLIQTVYNIEQIKKYNNIANKLDKKLRTHIKIDTGMNRLGFKPKELTEDNINQLKNLSNINFEGLYTHFAQADEKDNSFNKKQIDLFENVKELFVKNDFDFKFYHISNSAGIINFEKKYNLIRPGIILYGINSLDKNLDFKQIINFYSTIVNIKTIKKGEGVGYNHTYIADREILVATVAVGYADGFPRELSNCGEVIINNQKAPIIGNICMDQMMVDITGIDAKISDKVILYNQENSVDKIANQLNTISYILLTNISRRVPRIYVQNNKQTSKINYLN